MQLLTVRIDKPETTNSVISTALRTLADRIPNGGFGRLDSESALGQTVSTMLASKREFSS